MDYSTRFHLRKGLYHKYIIADILTWAMTKSQMQHLLWGSSKRSRAYLITNLLVLDYRWIEDASHTLNLALNDEKHQRYIRGKRDIFSVLNAEIAELSDVREIELYLKSRPNIIL